METCFDILVLGNVGISLCSRICSLECITCSAKTVSVNVLTDEHSFKWMVELIASMTKNGQCQFFLCREKLVAYLAISLARRSWLLRFEFSCCCRTLSTMLGY